MIVLHALRSALFYLAFYCGSALFVLAANLAARLPRANHHVFPDMWSRYHRWCLRLVGIRVRVEGVVPPGAVLVAVKHESFFDAIDMPSWLTHPVPFAKKELYAIPAWGRAALVYGSVPVDRQGGAGALRAMLAAIKRFEGSGRPLAIFPEGTRVPHGARAPLQAGFAALYKALGLPVVPVAVNSGPFYQHWIKRPGTITLLVGDPIPPGLPRAEIEARVLDAINLLNAPEASP